MELSCGSDENIFLLNGKATEFEWTKKHPAVFQVTMNGRRFEALLLKMEPEHKRVTLKINGNKYTVESKDQYDLLLERLGMDVSSEKKLNNVKAPMPGLVLEMLVKEGSEVKKGDALFVLEAMKMENIIKSPGDAVVRKIMIKKGMAVEKNQVIIEF